MARLCPGHFLLWERATVKHADYCSVPKCDGACLSSSIGLGCLIPGFDGASFRSKPDGPSSDMDWSSELKGTGQALGTDQKTIASGKRDPCRWPASGSEGVWIDGIVGLIKCSTDILRRPRSGGHFASRYRSSICSAGAGRGRWKVQHSGTVRH